MRKNKASRKKTPVSQPQTAARRRYAHCAVYERARLAAARAPAGANESPLKPAQPSAFKRTLDEYIAAQLLNADCPESLSHLGALYAERGDASQAEAYFRRALALAPFTPIMVNLYQEQRHCWR